MYVESKEYTIRRIEKAIANAPKDVSYRDYIIATMQIMKFTMEEGIKIYEDQKMQFYIDHAILTLCLKNGIRLIDLNAICDSKVFRETIKKIDANETLSVFENEIKIMIDDSKLLVSEITQSIDNGFARNEDDSIMKLFDDETRFRVDDIIKSSFKCYELFWVVELGFHRTDGTSFYHIVELAEEYSDMNKGLSGRPYIPDGAGLLYSFAQKGIFKFCTSNVSRDLSVAYADENGIITEIIDRKADSDYVHENKEEAKFVLEISKGWFIENGIKVGDRMFMTKIGAMD